MQNGLLDFIVEWGALIVVEGLVGRSSHVDVVTVAVLDWVHRVLASSSSCRLFYEPSVPEVCGR